MTEIEKPDYNKEFRTLQWRRPDGRGQLAEGETVLSCEVFCHERGTGTDRTAEMVSDVAPYDLTQVRYRLKGGTMDTVYLLTVRIVTSTGQELAEKMILRVT